jgi:hypothetical protein
MKLTLNVLSILVFFAASSQAALFTFTNTLTGAQENPQVSTPGTGTATVVLDTTAQTLSVDLTFSGLTSGTLASHIHCCAPLGSNAGVATTTPTFAGFPLGVTAGTFRTVLDLTQASSYNPAFIAANGGTTASAEAVLAAGIIAGQSYLNIHTANFQSGEIRAQLIPEPATLSLLGLSLLGLAAARRRLS